MRARRRVLVLPLVAAMTALAFAGAALADTSSFSGTVPNGGCDAARPVTVSGPSRIEVSVSSTSSDNSVFGEIVAPDGTVAATGSYDTPRGGSYSVRVCSSGSSLDPPQIRYSGLIGTGPSGQPVLQGAKQPSPAAGTGDVLGATTTLQTVNGKGAIMTRAGLAWFTLSTVNGQTTLRVTDPLHHAVRVVKNMQAAYGSSTVRVTGSGVKLVLVRVGASSRITFSSPSFKAVGKVVRGKFHIVA
jgi:hypothetical protein